MKEICKHCKYLATFETGCLLGRKMENCKSPEARRGDKELVDRLIDFHVRRALKDRGSQGEIQD